MKKLDENVVPKGRFSLEAYRKAQDILHAHRHLFQSTYLKGYGVGFTKDEPDFYFLITIDPEGVSQLDIDDELEGVPVYWRDYHELLRTI